MKPDQLSRNSKWALLERIKELACLQRIARIVVNQELSLEMVLQQVVELLPPAWQYPKISTARIRLDGCAYTTASFQESAWKQSAPIVVEGSPRGTVEMFYQRNMPKADEGPFLKEERNLIDAVARQLALVVEQKQAEADKSKLHHQLLHADRLASIGMLAAGAAHELNEPIGNILGFVQLVQKCPGLPRAAKRDLSKIESASLQAREIIRNLLVFARQTTPTKRRVNLNRIVEEGLLFLKARCTRQATFLVCRLAPRLPEITADPVQLNQVLFNLVVNALQAMESGGRITIETRCLSKAISLVVADTGCGMSQNTLDQIFIPFFTTKQVGQGTGLGLPVVHGIVTSHGGSIKVNSRLGRGTRFVIRLPLERPAGKKRTA
jgi:two-component system, NtrC family, sensor kinase